MTLFSSYFFPLNFLYKALHVHGVCYLVRLIIEPIVNHLRAVLPLHVRFSPFLIVICYAFVALFSILIALIVYFFLFVVSSFLSYSIIHLTVYELYQIGSIFQFKSCKEKSEIVLFGFFFFCRAPFFSLF